MSAPTTWPYTLTVPRAELEHFERYYPASARANACLRRDFEQRCELALLRHEVAVYAHLRGDA